MNVTSSSPEGASKILQEAYELRVCEHCGGNYYGLTRYAGRVGPLNLCPSCCLELANRIGIDVLEVFH